MSLAKAMEPMDLAWADGVPAPMGNEYRPVSAVTEMGKRSNRRSLTLAKEISERRRETARDHYALKALAVEPLAFAISSTLQGVANTSEYRMHLRYWTAVKREKRLERLLLDMFHPSVIKTPDEVGSIGAME